jgi:hypothetical protein
VEIQKRAAVILSHWGDGSNVGPRLEIGLLFRCRIYSRWKRQEREMGAELNCKVKHGKAESAGRALLETSEIIFRGDFRLKIPLKEIRSIKAKNGTLRVAWGKESATFDLGPAAEKWAHKIRNPKTVIEKLGIKPGMRVTLQNISDASFVKDIQRSTQTSARLGKNCEVIFYGADNLPALKKVPVLAKALAPAGALWIVYPKGRPEIREVEVIAAGRAAKLTDVKVVGFSATHTALKFVIPVANR